MIFLYILKWIGIILAVLFGLLLLLCVAVLFVPVRYTVFGEYDSEAIKEDEKVEPKYSLIVSWLFHLAMIRKSIKSDKIYLHVLGLPIKRLYPPKEQKGKEKKHSEPEKKESEVSKKSKEENTIVIESTKTTESKETGKEKQPKKKQRKKRTLPKRKKQKKRFSFSAISSIIKFIRDKATKETLHMLKGELMQVLKHVAPRHVQGELYFGTDDPANTGIILGIISMFPFAYQEGVRIRPDFERKILKAKGKVKGRMRVFTLLKIIIRVYRNQDVKKLIKRFHKLKEELLNGR